VYELNPTIKRNAESKAAEIDEEMRLLVAKLHPSVFTAPITQEVLLGLIADGSYADDVTRRRVLNALDSCEQDFRASRKTIGVLKACLKRASIERKAAHFAHRTLSGQDALV
jgi:hypothetical protein